ncbi:hypothetical protein IW262DRAFT_197073 [Armillaria fumosa]|nr:hypothetical protein IW262DRAFT_197073 [Armillaria fumosa]
MSQTTGAAASSNDGSGNLGSSTTNPSKGPEDLNMDKLRAKMSKDVLDRNARRAKRRQELSARGGSPSDISEDEKDEFDLVVQTVQRAVEAKALSSPVKASTATTPGTILSSDAASTSMDAALSRLYSDEATAKNRDAYIPNDTAFHEDYKALLVHRISIPLTMFHSSYLRNLQYNDDALPRVKITRLTSDGVSKNFSVLDIAKAPSEVDLSRADFLECYNNLLEFVASIGFGEHTLQGLNDHLHAMLSDPHFSMWFEAYKQFDKDYRAKLFKDPFIPDPSSRSWSDGVQAAKDNHLLMQQEGQMSGENGKWRRARPTGRRFLPYDTSQRGQPRSGSFRTLCLRCGEIGHRADSCTSSTPSKRGRSFLAEWKDNSLIRISDQRYICLRFNLNGCQPEPSPDMRHGLHICSLCGDPHHGATKCTRN